MSSGINKEWLINELEILLSQNGLQKVYYVNPNPRSLPNSNLSSVHRLAIPLAGCHRMLTVIDQQPQQIKPVYGQATFMPIGCWNKPDWELPVCVATFIFKEEDTYINVAEAPVKRGVNKLTVINAGNKLNTTAAFILECLYKLKDNTSSSKIIPLTEVLINYCLDDLKRVSENKHGKAYYTWQKVRGYLGEYFNTDIDRESVAQLFSLSPNYLSNLFKEQEGVGFSNYISELRVKHACHLLKTTEMTLDEITLSCGFNDTSYFCHAFKKHTGMTPGAYRNS